MKISQSHKIRLIKSLGVFLVFTGLLGLLAVKNGFFDSVYLPVAPLYHTDNAYISEAHQTESVGQKKGFVFQTDNTETSRPPQEQGVQKNEFATPPAHSIGSGNTEKNNQDSKSVCSYEIHNSDSTSNPQHQDGAVSENKIFFRLTATSIGSKIFFVPVQSVLGSITTVSTYNATYTPRDNERKQNQPNGSSLYAYDILIYLKQKGCLDFKEKEYPGLGYFIYEFNGVSQEPRQSLYWTLSLNGKKTSLGVSSQEVFSGDWLAFELKKD